MYNLLYGQSFNFESYKTAILNFGAGSSQNQTDLYGKNPTIFPIDKNPLIKNFYPLLDY